MKYVFTYFLHSAYTQLFTIILIIVVPVAIPYVMNFFMSQFVNTLSSIGVVPYSLPLLPQLDSVAYSDSNLVYFSYAPNTTQNTNFIYQLLALNNLTTVRTRGFSTPSVAEHYFNMKNIQPYAHDNYSNSAFYSNIICQDWEQYAALYYGQTITSCSFDLSQNITAIMQTQYNLSSSDLTAQVVGNSAYSDNILFHINFYQSAGMIGNIPQNITYEIVYNTTILDQTIIRYPDSLSQQFNNNNIQPYWTGYSQTLQFQLDQLTIQNYTNLSINYSFNALQQLQKDRLTTITFFELSIFFSWSFLLILLTLLASQNRGQNQLILRRLGVKEMDFWLINYLIAYVPTIISCMLMAVVWQQTAVLPFSAVTLGFAILVMFFVSVLLTSSAMFITICFSSSSVIISSFLALFMILAPGMLHSNAFALSTLYDPSLVPQWATWLFTTLLPLTTTVGFMDSMTNQIPYAVKSTMASTYNWTQQPNLIPIDMLFSDYNKYQETQYNCLVPNATNIVGPLGQCTFYQEPYTYLVASTIATSIILIPIGVIWMSYTITEQGFRGLPIFFMFSKKNKQKQKQKPGKANIEFKDLTVFYSTTKKKEKDPIEKLWSEAFGNVKVALKKLDFEQQEGQVTALVGETSSGKSTSLSFIAGEVNPVMNLQKVIQKRISAVDNKQINSQLRLNSYKIEDPSDLKWKTDDAQYATQILSYMKNVGSMKTVELQNFDMSSPIDAYYIKPYIGYLPQDFSNVWMNLSCFENVYFSLVIRRENQMQNEKSNFKKDKKIVEEILYQMDLSGKKVQTRKASQLSGGMLRRLGMCNAIASNPKILLLDEVTAGVDPVIKRKIWRCIERIQQNEQITTILSTHDTSEIAEMAQRITILDHGFTLLHDVSPFDLRTQRNTYSIKLYHDQPICSYALAAQIKQEISGCVENEKVIQVDSVSLHSIQLFIKQKIEFSSMQKILETLNKCVRDHGFQDFILSKANLDDVYMDVIKYKQEDNQKDINSNSIYTKDTNFCPAFKKFIGLLQRSFQGEVYRKFPTIVLICIVAAGVSLATYYLCNLVVQFVSFSNQSQFTNLRLIDLAAPCFYDCLSLYGPTISISTIKQCFISRPSYLFTNYDGNSGNHNKCGWYLSWLGLDYPSPYYAALGDYRYNNIYATNYMFSMSPAPIDIQPLSTYSTTIAPSNLTVTNSSIVIKNALNYQQLYSGQSFNPSINKTVGNDTFGIGPYVLPTFNALLASDGCTELTLCKNNCNSMASQALACSSTLNVTACQLNCTNKYSSFCNVGNWTLYSQQSVEIVDNISKFIKSYYQYSISGQFENTTQYLNYPQYFSKYVSGLAKYQAMSYYDVSNYNVNFQSNQLSGSMTVNLSSAVPNRGRNGASYITNYIPGYAYNQTFYLCGIGPQNVITRKLNINWPSVTRPHAQTSCDAGMYQSLPDKDHVVLFDIANQPQTQFIGAILRKQMYQQTSDYSPMNSSYSLVSRAMSLMSNANQVSTTLMTSSNMSNNFIITFVTVRGMLPMFYSSLVFGTEIEQKLQNLLKFHFVSPQVWAFSSLFYYMLLSLLPTAIGMGIDILLIQQIFSNQLNFLFFIVENLESTITGMAIILIVQKVKISVSICFIIFALMFVLLVMQSGQIVIAKALSCAIPAFSASQLYFDTMYGVATEWTIFIWGLATSAGWLGFILLFTSWPYLISKIKKRKTVTEKDEKVVSVAENLWHDSVLMNSNVVSSQVQANVSRQKSQRNSLLSQCSQRDTILDIKHVIHKYNTGTLALNNISFCIEKGIIFGLLGSNGSGKSTLMNSMAGIVRPTSGQALVTLSNDKLVDVFQVEQVAEYFSVIPQHDVYWPNLTINEHLRILCKLNARKYNINIPALISLLSLDEYQDRPLSQLSGGVKRRASIAMAMTNASPLLAFDEPTTGLGVTTKRFVRSAIQASLTKDTTVILTTHDMEEVEALIDQCCILNYGNLLKQGKVSSIRNECRFSFELSLKCDEAKVKQLAQDLKSTFIRQNRICGVWVISIDRSVSEVETINALKKQGLYDSQWNIEAVKIEQVFMDIIDADKDSQKHEDT